MSLHAWEDKYALSLGVELNDDGSINPSSVILTPSVINVDYRLTYDQVDEMLDEGVGYAEEWQLGALLAAATKRRSHRVNRGSTEGMVPFPIPKGMVTAKYDEKLGDYDISLRIETTHNSGANITTGGGEAIGKWQMHQAAQEENNVEDVDQLTNELKLPFRRQPAPDFKSRDREKRQMDFLYEMGKRYPHAWYARRFFNKVHAALKRYLRRKRVNKMLREGKAIPSSISKMDLGCELSKERKVKEIDSIDYTSGLGMIFAGRPIQSSSSNYWTFEYIRRLVGSSDEEVMFESVVLGCINKDRNQYAIYIYELGLEHRYLSEAGKLEEGKKLWLKVASVNPKMELLTFSLASKSGGIHAKPMTSAPAA
eukprot:scaffold5455_cov145-Skeletonema_menzelii.AAC.4